jgi:hypothetical protein
MSDRIRGELVARDSPMPTIPLLNTFSWDRSIHADDNPAGEPYTARSN